MQKAIIHTDPDIDLIVANRRLADAAVHLHQRRPRRFSIAGVLLDKGDPGMAFSLEEFCQNIYRTSQLLGDDSVRALVSKRV